MKKSLGLVVVFTLAGTALMAAGCSGSSYGAMTGGGGGAGVDSGTAGTTGANTSAACQTPGTLKVTSSGPTAYLIDRVANPDLTLCRGATYVFAVNAPGHPFYIKTVQSTGTGNAYDTGVTGNGATNGNVTFTVPADAPETLYYNCSIHPAMTGTIHLVD